MAGPIRARRARRRSRVPARLAVLCGVLTIALALVAPPVSASYARVEASVGCDGAVTWRASASSDGDPQSRTNPRVAVDHRPAGDQGDWTPAGPDGEFSADNDYTFTGSFLLPEGVEAIELRVTPIASWGDGGEPGDPRFAVAELPPECGGQPLVASQQLDCVAGAIRVQARNVGEDPLRAEITSDRVEVRTAELAPGASTTLAIPVLDGRDTTVSVRAGDLVASEQTLGAGCEAAGPAGVVVERCGGPNPQAVVLARGDSDGAVVQIRVDGTIVNRSTFERDRVAQRTLELPAGSAAIEVAVDDEVVTLGRTGSCEGPIAGILSCGGTGRPACDDAAAAPPQIEAPPAPPPPLTIELDGPTLPRTGPWERAIALLVGGVLLLGGGLALAARDRRRVVPSVVAQALSPYRQQWWDDL